MIWNAEADVRTCRDAVCEYVRGQLRVRIGGRITHAGILEDVAAALSTAWQQDFRGVPLPPDALVLMAARILWRVGEADAARALMDGMTREANEANVLLALVEAGGPSLSACIGLGAGVLRPAESLLGGGRPCWTLDLACLTSPDGHLAEFDVPGRLRRILSRTSEIWDRSDGDGVLGIARPGPLASAHLVRLIQEEVPVICRTVLGRIQVDRGWSRCPTVCRRGL